MSEFTYACPVCGQHIKCDSLQAGTVMECPTCFQKITVPQAPSTSDPKFIITGTKVGGERPVPKITEAGPIIPVKGSPVVWVVLVLLICAASAAVFVFRGKIFKPAQPGTNQVASVSDDGSTGTVAKTNQAPPKPAPVAPPSNDTNWMMSLDAVTIPDAPVAGRIDGQDFIIERAVLQNGTLTLREGTRGPLDFGLQINFSGAQAESLAGQSLKIATNALMAAHITMFWRNDGQIAKENLAGGYAMQLNFGQVAGNRLSGKIYFCAPDEMKSYIAGTFNAEIRKPKPKRQN
jgi:DNA-directed RNA polymerase subunit RPC12/RpoP